MMTQIYSKTKLISLYKDLAQRLGAQPKKKQWDEDANTPSEMPIRCCFGNWTDFVIACGDIPRKPHLSRKARENSAKSHRGKRSFNWKGGRIKDRYGYVLIWKPGHPNAKGSGYIHEHRLVMSKHLGRPLKINERVHHKDKMRDNNKLRNLELVEIGELNAHEIVCPRCKFKWMFS